MDNNVAPDVVWISRERLQRLQDPAGHLLGTPELVVEVLSPGSANQGRDREIKLGLYSRQGVLEYWILDWQNQVVEVYHREQETLQRVATLGSGDELTSPLLPGLRCPVTDLWPPDITIRK